MDKELELKSKLRKFLPNAEFNSMVYYPCENCPPNYIFLASPNENIHFKGSKYFFKADKNLVHFTSLESLNSIIKNGTFRLYNLQSMNDPREFEFAGSVFMDNTNQIEDSKELIFSMSFCPEEILFKNEKKDQFNLWRLYGKSGMGAAIIVKFDNSPLDWKDHHISKVHYGNPRKHIPGGLGGLFYLIKSLNKTEPKIGFDFGKFFCFHKSDLFSYEREIRLIIDCRQKRTGIGYTRYEFANKFEYPKISECNNKTDLNGKSSKYVEIPLANENIKNEIGIPKMTIDSIILGHAFTTKEFGKIKRELESEAKKSLNYTPKIRRSNLTFDYWGKNM